MGRLTARQVATLGEGYHHDGDGLYLQVTGAGGRSWILRYQHAGRKRDMGLGPVSVYGLAEARQRATQQRRLLADGVDPIAARRAARAPAQRTWGEAKRDFIQSIRGEWKSTPDEPGVAGAQELQWTQSLADYGPADDMAMAKVDTDVAVNCLLPIWQRGGKVETATRVRGRCERIWDAERVRKNVAGENPFRWRGHLEHLLPKPDKIATVRHHPAMPFADMPAFMSRLRSRSGLARVALRFTVLTAARTDEVIGAEWPEFDLDRALWTVPAHRMKGGREHIVPLVDEVVQILRDRRSAVMPFPLSNGGMLALLQKPAPKGFGYAYTVHGFRSSFRDWVSEMTQFPGDVAEMALAHKIKDETEAAYRRGALVNKRRELMNAWADYCHGDAPRQAMVTPSA